MQKFNSIRQALFSHLIDTLFQNSSFLQMQNQFQPSLEELFSSFWHMGMKFMELEPVNRLWTISRKFSCLKAPIAISIESFETQQLNRQSIVF